ncbi:TPA: hypothetical protein ACOD92_000543 [Stenotrophomonas maltophilia]|uniref:hypothetical protein n=1 Tax=Stenotrophomonas maltophilia group sp. Smal13 TaxID=3377166 RepID=UPI00131160A8|nr:hypothetical protein [Stenotrophomonas maltophilia]EKU9961524.1 hypothetical protein [Stenotrophomonas maltophilia]EKU9987777.1 hypothetical protein [Stenotrophomonas maltophilia]
MTDDLSDVLKYAARNPRETHLYRDAITLSSRIVKRYEEAVSVDVIHRSQVGACIPFTALPKHYQGKKVRIVIVDPAYE